MADRTAYNASAPLLGPGEARTLHAIGGTVAIATGDLALNKTVALFKAPKGFNVVSVSGKVTDLDTGGAAALVLDIGDADDDDRFVAASDAGQAGGVLEGAVTAIGHTFAADTEIVMTASTAAATAAAGTVTFYLIGYFD